MSKRLLICLVVLTLLPLAVVAWLGVSRLRDQQRLFAQQYRDLLSAKLQLIVDRITVDIEAVEQSLHESVSCPVSTHETLRSISARHPLVRQAFRLDTDNSLVFPDTTAPLSGEEREFVRRTRLLLRDPSLFASEKHKGVSATRERRLLTRKLRSRSDSQPQSGWTPWYWDEGLHIMLWQRCRDGHVVGLELWRVALVARLVGALPETANEAGVYRLRDAAGRVVYQWGSADSSSAGEQTLARVNLPDPFRAWTVSFEAAGVPLVASLVQSQTITTGIVLIALALIVVVAAVYFYRDSSRHLREARMRVNFVNQVSHELKTPLTNIQLYAEMLKESASEDDPLVSSRLDIVLSESRRLSRMITNILTFAKKTRSKLVIRAVATCVDDVIENVVEQCRLSLEKRGIGTIEVEKGAGRDITADPDAVGQIIANLIGNVEKYAASGGYLGIRSMQDNAGVRIVVSDRGPGISPGSREAVFKPYHRESSSLTEGVSGAGIGLSIARDLARMHGGDLVLLESESGCVFEIRLPSQPTTGGKP